GSGGGGWGCAVVVAAVAAFGLFSARFGRYFAPWRRYRDLALRGAQELRGAGIAGGAATLFGLSTGACSVSGCGAPMLPVLGLAFVGLESGTLHFLAQSSRVATIALFAVLALAVAYLGCRVTRATLR